MKTFLQIVTDNLILRMGGIHHLEQCTLVFPMQRAGLFVKRYISQLIEQSRDDVPVVLPRMTTIDSLVDELCPLHANDEITSVFQLYEIYKLHTSQVLPLDAFYGWGVQLLNDFSSVDMALLSGDDIMHYTSTIKRYEEMDVDEQTRARLESLLRQTGPQNSVKAYFTSLWKTLPNIYHDFSEQQTRLGMGSRGARTAWVIRHWNDEMVQQSIAGRTYVFVGFNYLLAAEWKLMELLRKQALYYWDYDTNFTLDDNVYRFIRSNMQYFPNALDPTELKVESQKSRDEGKETGSPSITTIACQSSSAQAQYVHEWLLEHYHAGESTAVVVADESMLPSVVYALPDGDTLKSRINITKGYPLRNTRLFAQVCTLLKQLVDEQVPVEQILPQTMAALRTYYDALPRTSENSWQTILQDESYYQIQVVLLRLNQIMECSEFVRSELSEARIIYNLVSRQLEQVNIPFHGEPVTDIQIIGVLETRLLDFNHVLILNVEEGVVPAISADRSFLPYDLRREYKMATSEEDAQIYAYNFFRLFRRATDVTLMFSDSFTDKGKRTMSRFLMQLLSTRAPLFAACYTPISRVRLSESAKVTPFVLPATVFTSTDHVPAHLSPSAISEYITCPRWFYLDKVLHLATPGSCSTDVLHPANVIGDLLHATLKTAYLDMCNVPEGEKRQLAHPVEITQEMLSAYLSDSGHLLHALDRAYDDLNNSQLSTSGSRLLTKDLLIHQHEAENRAIIRMAQNVLELDRATAPFTLVWLEHPVNATIGGFTLSGIIDRMDIVTMDGERFVRVLDYKTGGYSDKKIAFSPDNLFTDPDKRYALQTLIYCELLTAQRSLFHQRSGLTSFKLQPQLLFTGRLSEKGFLQCSSLENPIIRDYAKDVRKSFVELLEAKLQEISNNMRPGQEFIMQTNESVCANSYCPFHLLCNREKKDFA